MNGNGITVRWVGIIVGILLALGGWFYAHSQTQIESLRSEYIQLLANQKVIIERLDRINIDMDDFKQELIDFRQELKQYVQD